MTLSRAQFAYDMQEDPQYSHASQRKADAYQIFCDAVKAANRALTYYDSLNGTYSDNVSPIEFIEIARGK